MIVCKWLLDILCGIKSPPMQYLARLQDGNIHLSNERIRLAMLDVKKVVSS